MLPKCLFAVLVVLSMNAFAMDWNKHPHLKAAHEKIEHAKKALSEANDHKKTEFGGHRAKAMEFLNQADKEVEEAVKYADSNAA